MGKNNCEKYEFRYENSSGMNKIAGYTLIPEIYRVAALEDMNEQKEFQINQQHLLEGECEQLHELLI